MYLSKQLHKLEKECSDHWLHQIKEASQNENINDIEYSTYSLLRFFRCLDESELREVPINDFYRQIIQFIRETEPKNEMNNNSIIHFFRSIMFIIISDFYRGFDEINKITLKSTENEDERLFSFKIEKSDIFYIKISCLTFFKRYTDAFLLFQQLSEDEIQFHDELMQIDSQIRRSFILSKLKKREESIQLLTDIKKQDIINIYPFLSQPDLEFQIGAIFFSDTKKNSIQIGFDILMDLASLNPDVVFYQLAYAHAMRDEYDEALEYIEKIELDDRTFSMNLFISYILYKVDKFSESYEILKGLLKCSQFLSPVFELIGLIFLKTAQYSKATEFLRNAYVLDQTNGVFILNYGLSLESQKETAEMADQFYSAMMKRSHLWEVYANRSCVLNLVKKEGQHGCRKIAERVVEPQLESIVLSPADEQIESFFQAAPFFPPDYFASIESVNCEKVPISPLQRRISLFSEE